MTTVRARLYYQVINQLSIFKITWKRAIVPCGTIPPHSWVLQVSVVAALRLLFYLHASPCYISTFNFHDHSRGRGVMANTGLTPFLRLGPVGLNKCLPFISVHHPRGQRELVSKNPKHLHPPPPPLETFLVPYHTLQVLRSVFRFCKQCRSIHRCRDGFHRVRDFLSKVRSCN